MVKNVKIKLKNKNIFGECFMILFYLFDILCFMFFIIII